MKIKKTIIITGVVFILFSSVSLFGSETNNQRNPKNDKKIQLNAGYYNLGSIDEIYSYNCYSGSNLCYGLKYYYGKGPAREFTAFRFATINRTPGSLTIDKNVVGENARERVLNSIIFDAIYSCQYPINLQLGSHFSFFVTGDWITTINITSNSYGAPELIRTGISPGAMLEANLKKHTFSGRFSVPFISWTIRNNYSQSMTQNYESLNKLAFVKQNDQLQFPNTLMEIDTEFEYNFNLSKHFNIGCEYDFRYMYNSSPRKLESVTGIYSLGLTYKF
jgi:hypothetical protein